MKILYVEDEELMRRAISRKIEHAGYDVRQAGDGTEALTAMQESVPDLILCDDMMPNMTGLELLLEIRSNYPQFADVPFVLMSGKSDRSQLLNGLELGADDYLIKPVDIELMLAKIKSMTRLKNRFEKKKNLEKANIYRQLKRQDGQQDQYSALFDNLLERLEHEYEECVKLKESAVKMKAELMAERTLNRRLIAKLNAMEGEIDASLSRLLVIREKVEETKVSLTKETTHSEKLWGQLEEIGRTVDATIIPISKHTVFARGNNYQ